MLILDNFVHSDLHPGNILVTLTHPSDFDEKPASEIMNKLNRITNHNDWQKRIQNLQKEGYIPKLVFIDTGLVASLSDRNLTNFLDLFNAITKFDGKLIANLMIERSHSPDSVINKEEFIREMEEFLNDVKLKATSLQHLNVGKILGTILNMVRCYHVKLEGDFVNVCVGIGLIEGIGRRLDPKVDVIQQAVPVLKLAAKKSDAKGAASAEIYKNTKLYSEACFRVFFTSK
jgi:aarF domain-containing kinase